MDYSLVIRRLAPANGTGTPKPVSRKQAHLERIVGLAQTASPWLIGLVQLWLLGLVQDGNN